MQTLIMKVTRVNSALGPETAKSVT